MTAVTVDFDVLSDSEKQTLQQRLGRGSLPQGALARVKNVICVGSGKGGVGKSTVTANLACALQAEGMQAAVMDADVWGYSIPRMLGVHGRPSVSAERKIIPLDGPGGVKAISIEFFLDREDQAITWRGPMLHKAIRQFLEDVDWGELDYLLIDLPPGTGRRVDDARAAAAAGAVRDRDHPPARRPEGGQARRGHRAALRPRDRRRGREHVAASRPPRASGSRSSARAAARRWPTSSTCRCSGKVPLQEELRVAADEGRPLVLEDPDAPAAQALCHTARGVIAATPQEPAVLQHPSGAPIPGVPEVTGTALPMAQ